MAARWDRVAFDVSISDVEELEDVMAAHGWDLDDEEPTVHARIARIWFAPCADEPALPGKPDAIEWAEEHDLDPDDLDPDDVEPDPDPGREHREHVHGLMTVERAWDELDTDGGLNPFAPPLGGGWAAGG